MLSITDISVRIAGRLLIDNSSAQIVPGARVGFVGRNGVGKSTLFHAIRGELPTETGSITIPPRWRVGSLAQEAPNGPESLIEIVLKADVNAMPCCGKPRPPMILTGSPRSKPGSSTSTRIRRPPVPPPSL